MAYSDEQFDFITAPTNRHIKLIAPPGSGKTYVTCARAKFLVNEGFSPNQILISMFNKPAGEEVRAGLAQLNMAVTPQVRHFHSLGYRICKTLVKFGYLKELEFVPEEHVMRSIASRALKEAVRSQGSRDLDPYNSDTIEGFVTFIQFCKAQHSNPLNTFVRMGLEEECRTFVEAYLIFERYRIKEGKRFFDDLICDPVSAFDNNPQAISPFVRKISHLLIDEYQDINPVTNRLFTHLAGDWAKVTVIGDDDQTINTWRGSDPSFLLSGFDKAFPQPLQYQLTKTYRFGHAISLVSNNVIQHNSQRIPKMCNSIAGSTPAEISVRHYPKGLSVPYSDGDQRAVVDSIKAAVKNGKRYSDIAVLMRIYKLAPHIELALIANGIPYILEGKAPITRSLHFSFFRSLLSLFAKKNAPLEDKVKWVRQILQFPNPFVKASILDVAAQEHKSFGLQTYNFFGSN